MQTNEDVQVAADLKARLLREDGANVCVRLTRDESTVGSSATTCAS